MPAKVIGRFVRVRLSKKHWFTDDARRERVALISRVYTAEEAAQLHLRADGTDPELLTLHVFMNPGDTLGGGKPTPPVVVFSAVPKLVDPADETGWGQWYWPVIVPENS